MAHLYEVEIKTLLGSKDKAEKLKQSLQKKFPDTKLVGQGKQLNHYFNTPTDLSSLEKNISPLISDSQKKDLKNILEHGKKISIRTRDADGTVIFVIKASVGDDTSSNGVKRIEFEAKVPKTLAELDQLLLDSGCTYQAKWSREREEYKNKDMQICIDRNAGYGYVAEFEKVTPDESALEGVKKDLLGVMSELGVEELPQDRLERMFAHYNSHWAEYYGTEKTFSIE
jgi:predicted adenylyl cyclase CyaB